MGKISQIQQAIEEKYPQRAEEFKAIFEEYLQGRIQDQQLPQELVQLLREVTDGQ